MIAACTCPRMDSCQLHLLGNFVSNKVSKSIATNLSKSASPRILSTHQRIPKSSPLLVQSLCGVDEVCVVVSEVQVVNHFSQKIIMWCKSYSGTADFMMSVWSSHSPNGLRCRSTEGVIIFCRIPRRIR